MEKAAAFTPYQKLVIALLALTQFTVILDFMVISPLGAFLMQSLSLKPSQFGLVVSAYALSAGTSGFLTAGFADKFDRKKLLLFFYSGFIAGTLFCGLAQSYYALLVARIITGIFGGVIGSISMAIVADLFPIEQRGRVSGFMSMGFGGSQVLGIPIGLYMAHIWGWQSPFWLVVGIAVIIFILIALRLQPVRMHLSLQGDKNPLDHLLHTIAKRNYRVGFTATALLSIGGFMMMPFGSAFAVNNLLVKPEYLSILFFVAGIGSFISMPLIGKLSDKVDKFRLFVIATIFMSVLVITYTNLGPQPLWFVIIFNILMMTGIFGRIIPATALATAIPEMQDRGAFMSINSSLQQIAGGIGAFVAGKIVVQATSASPLQHYNTLGLVVVSISFFAAFMMYRVDKMIKARKKEKTPQSLVFEEALVGPLKGEDPILDI
jgi:predicted MFS family arabinose efflux permease